MKLGGSKVIVSLMALFALVLVVVTGMGLFFLNYNYLIIKSPYVGYELGYEPIYLTNESFLSIEMKNVDEPVLSTELLDSSLYTVDSSTMQVTDSDKDLLYINKYPLEFTLGTQREGIIISITDTIKPVFTGYAPVIYIEQGVEPEKLLDYFNVEDKDYLMEFGIYPCEYNSKKAGTYAVKLLAYDTSGNYLKAEPQIRVLSKKEIASGKFELSTPIKNYDNTSVFKTEDEFTDKMESLDELREELTSNEEDLMKELLKDDYDDYKAEEETRRKDYQEDEGLQETEDTSQKQSDTSKKKEDKKEDEKKDDETEDMKEEQETNTSDKEETKSDGNTNKTDNKGTTDKKNTNNTTGQQKEEPKACVAKSLPDGNEYTSDWYTRSGNVPQTWGADAYGGVHILESIEEFNDGCGKTYYRGVYTEIFYYKDLDATWQNYKNAGYLIDLLYEKNIDGSTWYYMLTDPVSISAVMYDIYRIHSGVSEFKKYETNKIVADRLMESVKQLIVECGYTDVAVELKKSAIIKIYRV